MVGIRNILRGLRTASVMCVLLTQTAICAAGDDDSRGRSTAVALNYCRASFHRIRRYPSKRVLVEEQEKILNNLDLNGIGDEEVIRLYSAVLDEISQVQIAGKEREVLKDRYKQTFRRQLTANAFFFGTQLATGQYLSAVRTGANSWWDYRTVGWQRELDIWGVDRKLMGAVVDKSSRFLDTFWKLAQKKNIPDHWLVRGDDLDKLEEAVRDPDPVVRLRVLKRMEHFMECYPPYWYYVARTQQALGQLFAATATYERLADLGVGHFRNDQMLAASLANLAVIQEYLQQPGAAKTAAEALRYSTSVWEVNLMCAGVLAQHGELAAAEDAILRNLDVDLEREQSVVALLSLYYGSDNNEKLLIWLNVPAVVRDAPVPVLLRCAAKLDPKALPEPLVQHIASSLRAYPDLHFGPDDLVIVATPGWKLEQAKLSAQAGPHRFDRPSLERTRDGEWLVRFRGVLDLGSQIKPESTQLQAVAMALEYPGLPQILLSLRPATDLSRAATRSDSFRQTGSRGPAVFTPIRHNGLGIVALQMDGVHFSMDSENAVSDTVDPISEKPNPDHPTQMSPPSASVTAGGASSPKGENSGEVKSNIDFAKEAPPPPKFEPPLNDADKPLTVGDRPR